MKILVTLHKDNIKKELKKNTLRTHEGRQLHRLHCVTLVAQGHSCSAVAEWLGETPRTVQRWVSAYNQGGVEALRDDERPGRPPRLSQRQRMMLKRILDGKPSEAGYEKDVWDSGLVQRHLLEAFNMRFSIRQCQRLIKMARRENTQPLR